MAEIPLDARRQMAAQQDRLELPAMYDALTWYERREVREKYTIVQCNRCYYCKSELDMEAPQWLRDKYPLDPRRWGPEFLKHPIHLHHCHRSGLTLGATHAYCNAILAQYHGE